MVSSRRARVLVLASGLLAIGCGTYEVKPSKAPERTASETESTICVARLNDDGTTRAVPVWDNAVLVAALTPGSRMCWSALPGRHWLMSELLVTAELAVDVRAGSPTWVLVEADSSLRHAGVASRGYRAGRRREWVKLVAAREGDAEQWQAATSPVELVDVPTDQQLPSRAPIPAFR